MSNTSIDQTPIFSELPGGLVEELSRLRIELARQTDINKRITEEADELTVDDFEKGETDDIDTAVEEYMNVDESEEDEDF